MLVQTNRLNNTYSNFNNSKCIIRTVNNDISKDTFTVSNPKSKISFEGYKGYRWYGTDEDRKALKYIMELTPHKIDNIIEAASSRDRGILDAYTELTQTEYPRIHKAFSSFARISTEFTKVADGRFKELAGMNIDGSGLPLVGFTLQVMGGPAFIDEMRNQQHEVLNDIYNIVECYWYGDQPSVSIPPWGSFNTGVSSYGVIGKLQDYCESSRHLISKLSLDMPAHQKMENNISDSAEGLCDRANKFERDILKLFRGTEQAGSDVVNQQMERQTKRLFTKMVGRVFYSGLEGLDLFK